MRTLDHYFINGNTIDEIADIEGTTRAEVVNILRAAGLSIQDDAQADAATEAILESGFYSFQDYVQRKGLEPLKNQARELGVTRGALAKAHDAFRHYLRSTDPRGRVTGRDPRKDSAAKADR